MFKLFSRFFRILFRILLLLAVLTAIYTVYCFVSVPDLCKLQTENPKTTAFMEYRKEQWENEGKKRKIDQRWVPLSRISRSMKKAVLVAEDPRFYQHKGFDFEQIRISLEKNWEEKEIVRGASTITQQLMKNLYLSPARTPWRKWREAILTFRVERCVKKNRILEIYLNVIEMGEKIYGVEAASRRYFGKSAATLNSYQAAMLAATIPSPIHRNPAKRTPALIRKQQHILKLMQRN